MFLALMFCGCVPLPQDINIDFPFENRITVYGFWSLDRPYELFVGNSIRFNEAGILDALPDATVLLAKNGEIVDSLHFDQNRYVSTSNHVLAADNTYEIRINHPDYPAIRAEVILPLRPNLPNEFVSVSSADNEAIELVVEPWVDSLSFEFGYYTIRSDGSFIEINEPLDTLFPTFNLRKPFLPGEEVSGNFLVNKSFLLTPPTVPEPTLIELIGIECVAYRFSPQGFAYFEYIRRVNDSPLGSNELQIVDLSQPGNIEGGYGLLTYYEEVQLRIDF
jgi:hypothetical protein